MKKEEILTQKSGRELDIAVAINVMNYAWVTHMLQFSAEMEVKWIASEQEIAEAGGVVVKVKEERLHALKLREAYEESVPRYSSEQQAAAEVWRLLEAKSWQQSEVSTGWVLRKNEHEVAAQNFAEAAAKAALLEFADKN